MPRWVIAEGSGDGRREAGGEGVRETEGERETGGEGASAVGRGVMVALPAAAACAEDIWCCLRAFELPKARWHGRQLKCPLAVLWLARAAPDPKVFLQGTQSKVVGGCGILVAVVVGERAVVCFLR